MQSNINPSTQNNPVGTLPAAENTLLNHVPVGKKMLGSFTIRALSPRVSIIVPSVAINAGILSFAIRIPFSRPTAVPMAIMIGITAHSGYAPVV